MKEQVLLSLFLAALAYGIYKCWKTKNESIFYALVLVTTLQLVRYPFYLPLELSLSAWAFFGCGVLTHKIVKKKMERSMFIFSIVFFGFGLMFILQGLRELHLTEQVMAWMFYTHGVRG